MLNFNEETPPSFPVSFNHILLWIVCLHFFFTKANAFAGGKRTKGRGGGGRGVRGVDYGLGIGYSAESSSLSSSSAAVPSRSVAANSLRTGMMSQFKNNFVAASSNSQNQGVNSSSSMYANKRTVLSGFVSGGTIGGNTGSAQTTGSAGAATIPSGNNAAGIARDDAIRKNLER